MNNPEEIYFAELSLRLRRLGFEPEPEEDGLLPVKWECEKLDDGILDPVPRILRNSTGRCAGWKVVSASTTAPGGRRKCQGEKTPRRVRRGSH